MMGRGSMKFVLLSATAIALIACSGGDRRAAAASVGREAGSFIDNGDFGNSTMNNTLIQSGQRVYTIDLGRRFTQEVSPSVTFPFNSNALDENARAVLRQQADWIRQFPEVRFKVYGHTDLVGGTAYNRQLGLRRAQAVVIYLTSQGISRSRLEAVASFGETRPVIQTNGQERRNRRTVTEVSGFVDSHPSVLDGQYAEIIHRGYVASGTAPSQIISATKVNSAGGEE